MSEIESKLKEMGLVLPTPPKPVAAYVPALLHQGMLYVSGQLPMQNGQLTRTGLVGQDVSLEQAQEAAQVCTLNALSIAKDMLGSLEKIERVVRVGGFVASAAGFYDQPKVVNGASLFLGELLMLQNMLALPLLYKRCYPTLWYWSNILDQHSTCHQHLSK